MKYKRFGKWVFDSVVCLADKDELSRKDSEEKWNTKGRNAMNNNHRKPLQGTQLEYFDVREAVDGGFQRLNLNYRQRPRSGPQRL